jgi:hypothetical protein
MSWLLLLAAYFVLTAKVTPADDAVIHQTVIGCTAMFSAAVCYRRGD